METQERPAFTILHDPSSLYREFLAERQQILDHKWIESEKEHRDIGFERALTDWIVKHRAGWRRMRYREGILEEIQRHGIKIIILSGKDVNGYDVPLPEESKTRNELLLELNGDYVLEHQNNLRKSIVPWHHPVLGKIFTREYKEGNQNYSVHIEDGLEITVTRCQEGQLNIV